LHIDRYGAPAQGIIEKLVQIQRGAATVTGRHAAQVTAQNVREDAAGADDLKPGKLPYLPVTDETSSQSEVNQAGLRPRLFWPGDFF